MFYLLAASLLLLSGCVNRNLSPAGTLTTALSTPVTSLNPLYATDANAQHLDELTHAGLMRTDENLLPVPYLAASVKVLGPLTYEFRLRAGCKFSSGRTLNSQDVARSLAFYQDPKNESSFGENFRRVDKFEPIDDLTFRLHTKEPAPSLLADLGLLKILDLESLPPGPRPAVIPGAGPYRVTSLSPASVMLERVPASCLPLPPMPRIVVKTVRDDLSRYLKLKTGEIDLVLNELNFWKVAAIQKDPSLGLHVDSRPGINYSYLGLNLRDPALQDIRVRRALALSLDLDSLIQFKSLGMARRARGVLADRNFYANTQIPIVERNLPEARRLLGEAGYYDGTNGKPHLHLRLLTTTASFNVENAQVLAAQAAEAGIELEHRALEWGVFYADVKAGSAALYLLRWVGVTDPQFFREAFDSHLIGKTNRNFYQNPELDQLVEEGEKTMNRESRKKIYLRVQEILARDLPYISLWHADNVSVFRGNVRGLETSTTASWLPLLNTRKE